MHSAQDIINFYKNRDPDPFEPEPAGRKHSGDRSHRQTVHGAGAPNRKALGAFQGAKAQSHLSSPANR
jgi:hypothetical protein